MTVETQHAAHGPAVIWGTGYMSLPYSPSTNTASQEISRSTQCLLDVLLQLTSASFGVLPSAQCAELPLRSGSSSTRTPWGVQISDTACKHRNIVLAGDGRFYLACDKLWERVLSFLSENCLGVVRVPLPANEPSSRICNDITCEEDALRALHVDIRFAARLPSVAQIAFTASNKQKKGRHKANKLVRCTKY